MNREVFHLRAGIVNRAIIATLLFLIVVSLVILAAYTDLRSRALAQGERDLGTRAKQASDVLDRILQSRMIEAFTFADLPSMRGLAASDEDARPARMVVAMAELRAITAADTNVRAASVVDNTGQVILTTDGSMNAQWRDRPFVRESLAGHLFASPPSRDFGEISQYYSAPILDNATNVAGALVLRVAVQEMWDAVKVLPNVLVVDESGVRVLDTSSAPIPLSAIAPIDEGRAQQLLRDKVYGSELEQIRPQYQQGLATALARDANSIMYTDANGRAVRASVQRMATNSWRVVAFENEDGMVSAAQDLLKDIVLVSALSALAAACALVFVTYRSAARVS